LNYPTSDLSSRKSCLLLEIAGEEETKTGKILELSPANQHPGSHSSLSGSQWQAHRTEMEQIRPK